MILHFLYNENYFIEIEQKFYSLYYTKHLSISDFDNLVVKVHVKEKYINEYSPFCFNLVNKNENITVSNDQIKLYKFNKDEYYIKIVPLIKTSNTLFFNNEILIKNGTEIYYNTNLLLKRNFSAINLRHLKKENLDFFVLQNVNEKLVICLNKDKVLLCEKIKSFELNENSLVLLIDLKDNFCHGIVKEYLISQNEINLDSEYSVYQNKGVIEYFSKHYDKNDKKMFNLIIPSFLQSGKAKNINLCSLFLNEGLKDVFNIENFKSYFGDFIHFEIIEFSSDKSKVILFYEDNLKTFTFYFKDNLISNIETQ